MNLVTVTVSTYNSSRTVIDTLESILNQSWKDIELIIKDDASTDNSIDVCSKWIDKNGSRFVRTEILTTEQRLGIPANFNRGILAAKASWIKPIAGDDALMPDCIKDNMEYLLNHTEVKVLFSFNKVYRNEFTIENFAGNNPGIFPKHIISEEMSAFDQYKLLLSGNKISFAPSIFMNKDAILDVGLADEDLFSEDYQIWLKLTKNGYKLHFMDKETVLYRKHDYSINNKIKEYILKPHYFKTEDFRRRYIYPNISVDLRLYHKFSWIVNQIFRIDFFNRKNKINSVIHYLLNVIFNPFKHLVYFKERFLRH